MKTINSQNRNCSWNLSIAYTIHHFLSIEVFCLSKSCGGVCFNDITQCFAFCSQKIYIYHSLENIVDGLLLRLQSISTVKGTDCAIAQMFGSAEMEKVAKDFTPILQK